jgi:hypothetical protein
MTGSTSRSRSGLVVRPVARVWPRRWWLGMALVGQRGRRLRTSCGVATMPTLEEVVARVVESRRAG